MIAKINSVKICVFIAGVLLVGPVFAQAGYSLMLQASPASWGSITPGAGIHRIETGDPVVLTAVPAPGYQFVCWLGDVSSAGSSRTMVVVDGPKIIIAVFEKGSFADLSDIGPVESSHNARPAYGSGPQEGYAGPGSPQTPSEPGDIIFPDNDNDQESDNDIFVPAPEPATILMMTLGGISLRFLRRGPGR